MASYSAASEVGTLRNPVMLVVRWMEVLGRDWPDHFMALSIAGNVVRRVFKFWADA